MALDRFTVEADCACFRPTGPVKMDSLLSLFGQAMAECQALGVTKLLVDTTALKHGPLSDTLRFAFGAAMAKNWDRSIRLALVMRPDQMDEEKFAALVALNRGLIFGAYTTEEEGRAWLRARSD